MGNDEKKKNYKNNNQQRWQWNDAIVMGENKLAVTGLLEVTMRAKNLKMKERGYL